METFAEYILSEKDWIKKMEIVYYLQKKTGIFYDNSVILKTLLAKWFMEDKDLGVEKNLVITGIHVIGTNNSAEINIAPYKYLFFACFLENTDTVLEC